MPLPPGRAVIRLLRRALGTDRLAFVLATGSDGQLQSLQILDVGEPQSMPVLHSRYGNISGVEWIAKDEQLLVSAEASGGSSLWTVPASGSEPKRLDAPRKRPGPVHVSLDGERLAFSHEETKAEVWALENIPPAR